MPKSISFVSVPSLRWVSPATMSMKNHSVLGAAPGSLGVICTGPSHERSQVEVVTIDDFDPKRCEDAHPGQTSTLDDQRPMQTPSRQAPTASTASPTQQKLLTSKRSLMLSHAGSARTRTSVNPSIGRRSIVETAQHLRFVDPS